MTKICYLNVIKIGPGKWLSNEFSPSKWIWNEICFIHFHPLSFTGTEPTNSFLFKYINVIEVFLKKCTHINNISTHGKNTVKITRRSEFQRIFGIFLFFLQRKAQSAAYSPHRAGTCTLFYGNLIGALAHVAFFVNVGLKNLKILLIQKL